jgi:hypothetical protein
MTRRPGFGFVAVNTLMLWIGIAVGGFALWPIYRSPQIILVMVVVTVLGSAVAILGAVFRWPAPFVLLATVVAFLLFGVPLAVPGQAVLGVLPSLGGLVDLISGVALGWKQLLTIALPVGQYESLLVPFYALILVLTVVGLSIALRTRYGEVAVLAPVILLVAGIAFGPVSAATPIALGLGLLAVILAWIVWRRWYRRRTAIRLLATQLRGGSSAASGEVKADTRYVGFRTFLSAGLILILAAGTAVAAVTVLPPLGPRDVLRTAVEQPFQPQDYGSPLSGFRNYWEQPAVDSVMLTVRGLPKGSRIRIATLDSYDGVVYSVGSPDVDTASGSFTRVPYQYDQSGVSGRQVSLSVTVQDYTGVWLPTVGDFEKVAFTGKNATALRNSFFYNNTTGTAAVVSGMKSGDSYSLDAVLPSQPSMSKLSKVDAGSATVPPLTVLPAELTSVLNGWVSDSNGQGAKLVAMLTALKKNGYVSHGVGAKEPVSRSGHAADRINQLLTDQQMIGDAEQYSVTAALMARELGFPARVVMGFVPHANAAGVSEVRGSDISAWIEVDTAQYGWVTIDPNPPVRPIPVVKPKDPNQVARPQTIVPPQVTQATPPNPQSVPDSQQHDAAPLNPFLVVLFAALRIAGWVLLGILILLSPFLTIVAAKVRRRRRRRKAPTSIEQISGGWREFEDRVLDHGFDPPPAATRSQVAVTVGGAQPVVLAAVADRATFAPEPPDAAEAELVWRSVRELTASLDEGKSRWERIRARISLRSFGGYSVSKLFKR